MTYDLKGRLTDRTVGATSEEIGYTSYDKQSVYELGANTVRTVYNAFGSPVRTEVENDLAFVNTTFLILGYNENQTATYRASTSDVDPSVESISIDGLLRLGLAKVTTQDIIDHTSYRRVGDKLFEVMDHVGTVRAVVSDYLSLDVNGATAELISSADYDVYGAQRPYRTFVKAAGEQYPFGFQAMQVAAGMQSIGTYSTNFRLLDVRTGRWNSRDAVFDARSSSFEALGSLPTMLRDPSGLVVEPELATRLRNSMRAVVQRRMSDLTSAKSPEAIADAKKALDRINVEAQKLEEEIARLEKSPVQYGLGRPLFLDDNQDHWGRTRYDANRNMVVIDVLHAAQTGISGVQLRESLFHEWTHLVQFEAGQVLLIPGTDKGLQSMENEIEAYNAGYIRSGRSVEAPFSLTFYLDEAGSDQYELVNTTNDERVEKVFEDRGGYLGNILVGDQSGTPIGARAVTIWDSDMLQAYPNAITSWTFYSNKIVRSITPPIQSIIWLYIKSSLSSPVAPR